MLANRLRVTRRFGTGGLVYDTYSITSGTYDDPGGGIRPDYRYYGYTNDIFVIGSISPDFYNNGYILKSAYEVISYSSNNGTFTTPVARDVYLLFDGGPNPLIATDLLDLGCPGGQTLSSLGASFGATGSGGQWTWSVSTGPDSAVYFTNGTLTVYA